MSATNTVIQVAKHQLPVELDPRLIMLRERDSEQAASFRVLRHRLSTNGNPTVIAVTSADPKEGKTTCAANLGLALAEASRAKTLIVEANLRSPALGALFGFVPPSCFAAQMTAHVARKEEPWVVVQVAPTLHLLAVEPAPRENLLLDPQALFGAISQLRNAGYDYIVVDTSHVLGSADVNLVEEVADGVLLTLWSGKSRSSRLDRAVDQLQRSKFLGFSLFNV